MSTNFALLKILEKCMYLKPGSGTIGWHILLHMNIVFLEYTRKMKEEERKGWLWIVNFCRKYSSKTDSPLNASPSPSHSWACISPPPSHFHSGYSLWPSFIYKMYFTQNLPRNKSTNSQTNVSYLIISGYIFSIVSGIDSSTILTNVIYLLYSCLKTRRTCSMIFHVTHFSLCSTYILFIYKALF